MVWIIIVAVLLVLTAVLYGTRRSRVVASKKRLEDGIQGLLDSFTDLKAKIQGSDLQPNVKTSRIKNADQNIETIERWKNQALPNITFWKNHTEPIAKEFDDLNESVTRELSQYSAT
jgi:hypothetical protein